MSFTNKIRESIRELEDMDFDTMESMLLDTKFEVDHANFGDNEQLFFLAGIEQGLELSLFISDTFDIDTIIDNVDDKTNEIMDYLREKLKLKEDSDQDDEIYIAIYNILVNKGDD